jgi:RNA polymerase primary sigma factor
MGLVIAMDKFDWTKSNKFITFANQWVRHEMLMAIYNHARIIRLPVNIAMQLHKEIKVMNETNKELSAEIANLPSTSELDRVVGEDGTFLDILKNNNAESPDADIEFRSTMNYLLSKLDERSANIIKLLYGLEGEELDIKEVAVKLNIHKETVRQLKIKAIEKLEKRFLPSLK